MRIIDEVEIQPLKSGKRWTATTYTAAPIQTTRTAATKGATVFNVYCSSLADGHCTQERHAPEAAMRDSSPTAEHPYGGTPKQAVRSKHCEITESLMRELSTLKLASKSHKSGGSWGIVPEPERGS